MELLVHFYRILSGDDMGVHSVRPNNRNSFEGKIK